MMLPPGVRIERPHPTDAAAIARVHVESWRTTYAGLMPAEFLARLSLEQREAYWAGLLADPNQATHVFVARADEGVVGFACCGPNRAPPVEYTGELYAIYLLAEQQGLGIGRALFERVIVDLKSRGLHSLVIWVLAGNPACAFYERMGGVRVAAKQIEMGGRELEELAYGWSTL